MKKNGGGSVGDKYSRIENAIKSSLGWTLCFIGEDQSDKLAALIKDLMRGFSASGEGKQFASGFSYWGIGPTLAWTKACTDPLYIVMKRSISAFGPSWSRSQQYLDKQGFHYVSLGIGTGRKDYHILKYLLGRKKDLYFLPVDMSPTMLRIGIQSATKDLEIIERSRILPIEIDFSIRANVEELRTMLNLILGEEPILFSLLGNTLANFEHDGYILRLLSELVREQDRLLLELASTDALTVAASEAAAREYSEGEEFKRFVTSALLQNTDLHVDWRRAVEFVPEIEAEKAVRVKVLYRNKTGTDETITLPNGSRVEFPVNDTIRLYLSRKYTQQGIDELIDSAGLRVTHRENLPLLPHAAPGVASFGIDLMLLERSPGLDRKTHRFDIFLAHAGPDKDAAEELFALLQPFCRVFLDRHTLRLGDDWAVELAKAQSQSLITVVLVSSKTEAAYYEQAEIANAIKMARMDSAKHRVVPVYLEGYPKAANEILHGLELKHGISLSEEGVMAKVAEKLLELIRQLKAS